MINTHAIPGPATFANHVRSHCVQYYSKFPQSLCLYIGRYNKYKTMKIRLRDKFADKLLPIKDLKRKPLRSKKLKTDDKEAMAMDGVSNGIMKQRHHVDSTSTPNGVTTTAHTDGVNGEVGVRDQLLHVLVNVVKLGVCAAGGMVFGFAAEKGKGKQRGWSKVSEREYTLAITVS